MPSITKLSLTLIILFMGISLQYIYYESDNLFNKIPHRMFNLFMTIFYIAMLLVISSLSIDNRISEGLTNPSINDKIIIYGLDKQVEIETTEGNIIDITEFTDLKCIDYITETAKYIGKWQNDTFRSIDAFYNDEYMFSIRFKSYVPYSILLTESFDIYTISF